MKQTLSLFTILLLLILNIPLIVVGEKLKLTKASDTFIYSPTEINDYLANPGIGWQYMNSSDRTILPETVSYPDRVEISWQVLNPGENSYNWSPLDTKITQAVSEGKQISFRVYTMRGEIFGGHQVPQYVIDKGASITNNAPDYDSCVYEEEWGKFVEQMRHRYDGNSNIAFIDISGYGNFNEWSWQNVTQWENDYKNPTTTDGHARNRLVDTFLGGSNQGHKCVRNGQTETTSYNYTPWQSTQLIMPYAGIRQSLNYAIEKTPYVGFRNDCLGAVGYGLEYYTNIRNILDTRWKTAPIIFEVCRVDWNNTNFQTRMTDVLNYTHGSIVHDNPNNTPEPQNVIETLMKRVGYRYFLKEASYLNVVETNKPIELNLTWSNRGIAKSYPSMGQQFKLNTYLLNQNNEIEKTWQIDVADISQWLPNDNVNLDAPEYLYNLNLATEGINQGEYKLAVGINDLRTEKNINIANPGVIITNESTQVYQIGNITIQSNQEDLPKTIIVNNTQDISSIISTLKPGDTLILEDGIYSQPLQAYVSGIPNSYITIKSVNSGGAIFDGQFDLTNVVDIDGDYINLEGITVRNSLGSLINIKGNHFRSSGVSGYNANTDTDSHIWMVSGDNSIIEDCVASGDGRYLFLTHGADNVKWVRCYGFWKSNTTEGLPKAGFAIDGASSVSIINSYIDNVIPSDNKANEIWAGVIIKKTEGINQNNPTNTRIIGSIFKNIWTHGVIIESSEATNVHIENNLFLNINDEPCIFLNTCQKDTAAIYTSQSPSGIIKNNTFVNNKLGIWLGISGYQIDNNSFLGNFSAHRGTDNPNHSFNNLFGNEKDSHTTWTRNISTLEIDPLYKFELFGAGSYIRIPDNASLKGIGQGNEDIGAEILYRYNLEGTITNEPLWPWVNEERIQAELLRETAHQISPTWEEFGGIWKTLEGAYDNDPVIEDPVIEDPVIEDPVIEDPVIEDPVIEDPVIEDPVTEDPVIEDPVTEDPVITDPVNQDKTNQENNNDEDRQTVNNNAINTPNVGGTNILPNPTVSNSNNSQIPNTLSEKPDSTSRTLQARDSKNESETKKELVQQDQNNEDEKQETRPNIYIVIFVTLIILIILAVIARLLSRV